MIFSFGGNNSYLTRQEILRWKSAFSEKHGVESVFHFRLSENIQLSDIQSALLSPSIFNPKSLVIIDDLHEKSILEGPVSTKIIEYLPSVGNDTIVIINTDGVDKRSSIYKKIVKIAECKDFSVSNSYDALEKLNAKYKNNISHSDLTYLLQKKAGSYEKTIGELEKLLITQANITRKEIDTFVQSEYEESIFEFLDLLLNKDQQVFQKMGHICDLGSVFSLYYSMMANLRVTLYIMSMKAVKFSRQEISSSLKLGKREFLIDKRYQCSAAQLRTLFDNLIKIDSNMKQGKLLFSDEEYIKGEIEKALIRFIH